MRNEASIDKSVWCSARSYITYSWHDYFSIILPIISVAALEPLKNRRGDIVVTVSDTDKCVCIWGKPAYVDPNMISEYKARGYTIVRLSNGTGNIRECIKTVATSSGII